MKEQKAAEAVPKEHEEQETKADHNMERDAPHDLVVGKTLLEHDAVHSKDASRWAPHALSKHAATRRAR